MGSSRILIRAKKVMTRESYRLVENLLHFYTLNIHVFPLILHSHHANLYYLTRSCLYLLYHITQKSHGLFLYFSAFQLVPFYYIIFMPAILHLYHSSPSYLLFSISVAFKQNMFFCFDLPTPTTIPLTGRHPILS